MANVQATGTIAGHEAQFTTRHREFNKTPVALYITASVPMSYEDIVAALWVGVNGGMPLCELVNSPDDMHFVVVDTVVNDMAAVDQARFEIAGMSAGSAQWETVTQLRMAVLNTYGGTATAQSGRLLEVAR